MTVSVRGIGLLGIDGVVVEVQLGEQDGLPGLDIAGLPAASVREARHRVRSALRAAGYGWPTPRLVANFAPADMPKAGTALDLPLAVAILAMQELIPLASLDGACFFGEVGLDGATRPAAGAVNAAVAAHAAGLTVLYAATGSAVEAALVPGLEVRSVPDIVSLVSALRGEVPLAIAEPPEMDGAAPEALVDLAVVRGQCQARRALEIAAAGGHNLFFIGPPGCGKTLLARTLPGILPPMSRDERLEVTRVHSAAGRHAGGLVWNRPFRAPHATSSYAALVGGGNPPVPGEVSLAHRGVLFLDETPEFRRSSLEALRAPLEDRQIAISRRGQRAIFPASFMLVGAMNPCPCGHRGDSVRPCRCTPRQVDAYEQRLSGPLKDRVDLTVGLSAVPPEQLAERPAGEPSAMVRERVVKARFRQRARNSAAGWPVLNAELPVGALEGIAHLSAECRGYLARAARLLGLTARGWQRVIRVARTIADLAEAEAIERGHLAEALTYREPTKTA